MDEYIERKALREAFDNADADIVEEYEDGECDWGFARVCTNEKSPINGTFCPFEKHQYLCRLNNKSEETNAECNHD